jgi:hypothetical protein
MTRSVGTLLLVSCIALLVLPACAPPPAPGLGTSPTYPLVVSHDPSGANLHLGAIASSDPIRLHVESNSADASYRTNWTLGAGTCLRVVPRVGDPLVVTGDSLVADYYHVGRVLGVSIGPAGSQRFMAFGEPISWETIPCPAP